MLLDLLYSALPSRRKRRWHFNTFMLDIFRRIEQERIFRSGPSALGLDREHIVLSLAKDTVGISPILFLDEFQMPDRASSKLLNGFMTAFFHLGGVLVASSNRMPDELAKASGVEFGGMQNAAGRGTLRWAMGRLSPGQEAARSDFGLFLEVLKARCEVWEMEGERDWRRDGEDVVEAEDQLGEFLDPQDPATTKPASAETGPVAASTQILETSEPQSADAPPHYHITSPESTALSSELHSLNSEGVWKPATLIVYSRPLILPTTNTDLGIALCSFPSLCATNLGPADYITICSTFHTLILTDVPVLTILQKNEARRFITLLDALYEAKCRLLVSAEAPPDKLFFPETRRSRSSGLLEGQVAAQKSSGSDSDSIESEAFSEMYQDSTAPFRPNISMYDERHSDTSASPTYSLQNRQLRSVLADEDADFGPTYGNGRSHGASTASSADELRELEQRQMDAQGRLGPDFTNLGALTGEDEKFAYKRARSRLWEMCGRRWWRERKGNAEEWWRPVGREGDGRFWEGSQERAIKDVGLWVESVGEVMADGSHDGRSRRVDEHVAAEGQGGGGNESLFRHGASPYRTVDDPPPKFGWQHAWGMMRWGKKAGDWGKGVEGDRRSMRKARDNEGNKDAREEQK